MDSIFYLKTRRAYRNAAVIYRKITKRKGVPNSLFDVLENGYEDKFWRTALFPSNDLYGIEHALAGYSKYKGSVFAPSEHGVYFGSYVSKDETNPNCYPVTITFGPRRAEHLAKNKMPSLQIGPYIYYASEYLSEQERTSLKRKLGKVLLVFPMHSIESTEVSFELELLLKKISETEREYSIDTTLYCLYFADVMKGLAVKLSNLGKTVVCAGHRFDPMFLSRLKSLILLSDITASNGVGTHMGYSEVLGREHFFLDMDVKSSLEPDFYNAEKSYFYSRDNEIEEVRNAFIARDPLRKNEVLDRYWGISKIKSQKELFKLLTEIERAYKIMLRSGNSSKEVILDYCPMLNLSGATRDL